MKKIVYLFALVAIALTSCNPLEDINEEIDAIPTPPNVGAFEYTLVEDDYSASSIENAFSSEDEAKLLVPPVLDAVYPLYGEGSSVNVTYNLFVGEAEGLSDFTGATRYFLTNDDYAATGSDAFGFYPNVDATDEIPTVLDTQIMSPTDGQFVLAEYDQYFENPTVGIADLYSAEFPADFGNFEVVSIAGLNELGWNATSSNATGSGFNGSPNATEEWLVSPQIDLSGQSDVLLEVTQEIDFFGADPSTIDIMVSTTYTPGGGINAADWTAVSFDKTAFGSLSSTGDLDFSAYDDEQIYIAFRYTSTDSASARWRLQSFAVKNIGVSGDANGKGEYFVYDGGSWEEADDVYYLSDADYDSMGEEFGQPGRFNNFSNSTSPDDYLPQFLSITYPFAQEEDELFVIYKFFSGGISLRGDFYTFTDGEWKAATEIIETNLQFGFTDGQWVPDNTIRYTIMQSDFDYIEANYATTMDFEDAVASMANFGNFDRRESNDAYWSNEMILTVFADLLDNVIAPGAADGQKYVVTVAIFDGSQGTEDFSLIKEAGEWIYQ